MGEVIWLSEIYDREDATMGMAAKKERRANTMTPQTRRIIGRNVDLLWKRHDWKQPEPKGRTIDRYRGGRGNPTIESLEFIAEKANIPVWYLLVPNMDESAISDHKLADMLQSYLENPEKRQSIRDLVQALTK